ncbi:MAG: hypothetical protein L0H15_05545 [Nitrosospira sp.]|nr:hypothetical protein [Nitrosospira sp.]
MTSASTVDWELLRKKIRGVMGEVTPAGPPTSEEEPRALMLSSRTRAGQGLPAYFLVYFLLVDLLGYKNLGKEEKVAWSVPVRYQGRLYSVDHTKFGVGVFAPTHNPNARMSARPSEQAESDAGQIVLAINKAVEIAGPYFSWRAEQAASGTYLNVLNRSSNLFSRYEFFRDRFLELSDEYQRRKDEKEVTKTEHDNGATTSVLFPAAHLSQEAQWNAQAAVDAFFSWTEHVFIHLAILQGRARTGGDVAKLADSDWKSKFKAALDLSVPDTKKHYDALLELRQQIRNFMAHGAFGKRGEAFEFHSGAGAVPLLLTGKQKHKYSFTGAPAFVDEKAIAGIEHFVEHLWAEPRAPAREYIESGLPAILSYIHDGTYAKVMTSSEEMTSFLEYLMYQFDSAANMDW